MLEFIVQKASYLGFIVFLALCGLGLPIPEEAPLVLAGVLCSNETLKHPTLAFGACLIGALLGDSLMYFIGRRLGHGRLMKHPRIARFIDPEREAQFEHIVTRHGFKLVLLTRFLVGVRGPVYFAAGAARVPYWRFLLWDLIAATIVVSIVFGLGYYYGQSIEQLIRKAESLLTILVVAVVVVVIVAGFVHRRMKAAVEHLAEESAAEESAEQQRGEEPADKAGPTPLADAAAPASNGHATNGHAANGHADHPAADEAASQQSV